MIEDNPYVKILKLKGSVVDMSVIAITCAILGTWDYRALLVILAGIMVHSGCDIMNDIYDYDIDKICKPNGSIASGQMSIKMAWGYMALLFAGSLLISYSLSFILFLCMSTGIIIGGILYSHPLFRFKDIPGVAMLAMAVCFALESIGLWSIYSPLNTDSLIVAAYVFVMIFSLTFMKDFKDVAGDINSLPLMIGIRKASIICSLLTVLPLILLIHAMRDYHEIFVGVLVYIALAIGCIQILMDDPVSKGETLKNRMVMALTIPNFAILGLKMILLA